MVAVPVIVATGVAQTLKLAGNLDDVTSTSWGRTLLVKVAVVTVLVAIGGVSQWVLRNDGPPALKRNVLVEALIGIGVVGLAAALVALPPQSVGGIEGLHHDADRTQGVIADVTVTPGRVGQNEVHLVITPPGGGIDPVVSTTVAGPAGFGDVGFGAGNTRIDRPEPLHRHDRPVEVGRLDAADHRRTDSGPTGRAERSGADPRVTAGVVRSPRLPWSRWRRGSRVARPCRLARSAATRLPRLFWSVIALATIGPREPPTGMRPAATAAINALDTCAATGWTLFQSTWSASDRIVRATSVVRSAGGDADLCPVDATHRLGDLGGVVLERGLVDRPLLGRGARRTTCRRRRTWRGTGLSTRRVVPSESARSARPADSSPSRPAACCAFNDAAACLAFAVQLVVEMHSGNTA